MTTLSRDVISCVFVLVVSLGSSSAFVASDPTSLVDRSSVFEQLSRWANLEPEAYLRVPAIIKNAGYPVEVHDVHTEDGYTIEVHRIPHGLTEKEGSTPSSKIPVLFLHMAIFSGAVWVLNTPDQSPGFIFADQGYDVWIAQHRGTVYSLKHDTYEPTQKEFWNFTHEELGLYDTPAMVDYIIKKTGHKQIYIVAQHGGTISAMMMLSKKPEYNDKIKLFVGLSPIVTYKYGKSLSNFGYSFPNADHATNALYDLLGGEIPVRAPLVMYINRVMFSMMHTDYMRDLTKQLRTPPPFDIMRKVVYLLFAKTDGYTSNFTRYSILMSHFPDGMGVKVTAHVVQLSGAGRFAPFDYGEEKNLQVYGKALPDEYPLDKVTVPILATWTENELLVNKDEVHYWLPKTSSKHVDIMKIENPGWIHLDYLIAYETKETCYMRIIDYMNKFEAKNL